MAPIPIALSNRQFTAPSLLSFNVPSPCKEDRVEIFHRPGNKAQKICTFPRTMRLGYSRVVSKTQVSGPSVQFSFPWFCCLACQCHVALDSETPQQARVPYASTPTQWTPFFLIFLSFYRGHLFICGRTIGPEPSQAHYFHDFI